MREFPSELKDEWAELIREHDALRVAHAHHVIERVLGGSYAMHSRRLALHQRRLRAFREAVIASRDSLQHQGPSD